METKSNPFQNRSDLFSKFMAKCNNPFLFVDVSSNDLSPLNKAIQDFINEALPILFIYENREPSSHALNKLEKFSIDRQLDSNTINLIQSVQKRLNHAKNLEKMKQKVVQIRDQKFYIDPKKLKQTSWTDPDFKSKKKDELLVKIADNVDLLTLLSSPGKLIRFSLEYTPHFTSETPEIISYYGKHLRTLHLSNIPSSTQWIETFSNKLRKLNKLLLENCSDFSVEGFAFLKKFKLSDLTCINVAPLNEESLKNIQELNITSLTLTKSKMLCRFPDNFLHAGMQHLVLKDLDLAKDNLAFLKNLIHLKSLTLVNCKNLARETFKQLIYLNELESLNLSDSNFGTKEDLELFKHLTSLKQLNLSNCLALEVHKDPLSYLHCLPNLQGLALNGVRSFRDEDLIFLKAACPQLNTLWIKNRPPLDLSVRKALLKFKIGIDHDDGPSSNCTIS